MPLAVKPESLIVASRGTVFVSNPNVALPENGLKDLALSIGAASSPAGWERVPNTSRENLPSFDVEQGNSKILGSWDVKSLRTVYEDGSVKLSFRVLQHDPDTMIKFLNGWKTETLEGAVMPASNWAITCGLAVVILDGNTVSGYHIPNMDAVVTGLPSLNLEGFAETTIQGTAKAASNEVIKPNLGRSGLMAIYQPIALS